MLESNSYAHTDHEGPLHFRVIKTLQRSGVTIISIATLGLCGILIANVHQGTTSVPSSTGIHESDPTISWPSNLEWKNEFWIPSYPLKTNISVLGEQIGMATNGGESIIVYSVKGVSTDSEIAVLIKTDGPYVVYRPK